MYISAPELEIIFSKEANDDDGLMTENRALSRKFSKTNNKNNLAKSRIKFNSCLRSK